MLQKNFCRMKFSNFYKNVSDRSDAKENVLVRSVVTRSSVKLALRATLALLLVTSLIAKTLLLKCFFIRIQKSDFTKGFL